MVMQDAMHEVLKVYPQLMPRADARTLIAEAAAITSAVGPVTLLECWASVEVLIHIRLWCRGLNVT